MGPAASTNSTTGLSEILDKFPTRPARRKAATVVRQEAYERSTDKCIVHADKRCTSPWIIRKKDSALRNSLPVPYLRLRRRFAPRIRAHVIYIDLTGSNTLSCAPEIG